MTKEQNVTFKGIELGKGFTVKAHFDTIFRVRATYIVKSVILFTWGATIFLPEI